MTVRELIDILSVCNSNADVLITHDFGDYFLCTNLVAENVLRRGPVCLGFEHPADCSVIRKAQEKHRQERDEEKRIEQIEAGIKRLERSLSRLSDNIHALREGSVSASEKAKRQKSAEKCSEFEKELVFMLRANWKYYNPEIEKKYDESVISISFGSSWPNSEYSIQVWSRIGDCCYLRYCISRFLGADEATEFVNTVAQLYPQAYTVLMEAGPYANGFAETLKRGLTVVPMDSLGPSMNEQIMRDLKSASMFLPLRDITKWSAGYIESWEQFLDTSVMNNDVAATLQALYYLYGINRPEL